MKFIVRELSDKFDITGRVLREKFGFTKIYARTYFDKTFDVKSLSDDEKKDVSYVFAVMTINTIEELMQKVKEWDYRLVIGSDNTFGTDGEIVIYNDWIE